MIGIVCAMLLLAGTDAARAEEETLDAMLRQARLVQRLDIASWSRYRFRRSTVNEWLDDSGSVTERTDLEYLVTPTLSGFDEQLLEIDGHPPSDREVRSHRKASRFTRTYHTFLGGGTDPEDSRHGYSLEDLLRMSAYRYAGREVVDGVPCHRLEFEPGPAGEAKGLAGRFLRVMAGSLWISEDGLHLSRASAHTVRAVPIFFGLIRIYELRIDFQSAPVQGGSWLPRLIEIQTRMSILGVPLSRRHIRLSYFDFVLIQQHASLEHPEIHASTGIVASPWRTVGRSGACMPTTGFP